MTSSLLVDAQATSNGALRRNASPDRPNRLRGQQLLNRRTDASLTCTCGACNSRSSTLNVICNCATIAVASGRDIKCEACRTDVP
jgi:hypothetical protein